VVSKQQRPEPQRENPPEGVSPLLRNVGAFLALLVLLGLIIAKAFHLADFPNEAYVLIAIVGIFIFNLNASDLFNKDR